MPGSPPTPSVGPASSPSSSATGSSGRSKTEGGIAMPRKADGRHAPAEDTDRIAWKPTMPPGHYLTRKEAAAMMWAVIDIMACGTASVWHGVESWAQARREGIVEWYDRRA